MNLSSYDENNEREKKNMTDSIKDIFREELRILTALDGAPGVRSARYAGAHGDDEANNARLIAALAGVPADRRTARFCCAVALADGDRILARGAGVIEGRIIDQPRGDNGFGYDPHFLVPEFGVTTAEMPPEQKNRISHRGRALQAVAPRLKGLLAEAGRRS